MPDDTREDAKRDADRANDFYDRCIARGRSERIATEMTCAYVLARRMRRETRDSWEPGDE